MKKNDYEFVNRAIEVVEYIETITDEEITIKVGSLQDKNGLYHTQIFVVANNEQWFFKSSEDFGNEYESGIWIDRIKYADDFYLDNDAYLQLNRMIDLAKK